MRPQRQDDYIFKNCSHEKIENQKNQLQPISLKFVNKSEQKIVSRSQNTDTEESWII